MISKSNKKQSQLPIAVGDMVVYPTIGLGKVSNIEEDNVCGIEMKLYVINFSGDLVLKIPVSQVKESGLRQVSDEKTAKKVELILAQPNIGSAKIVWSRRMQEYERKIHTGDLIMLAEVVRELCKNVTNPDRSYSERIIFETAFFRLASEMSAIRGIEYKDYEKKLNSLLMIDESLDNSFDSGDDRISA